MLTAVTKILGDWNICWQECEFKKSFRRDPLEPVVISKSKSARLDGSVYSNQLYRAMIICELRGIQHPPRFCFHAEFLKKLAFKTFFERLAIFEFSTWKLPETFVFTARTTPSQ